MDKLCMREELIITRVKSSSQRLKRVFEKDKWKDKVEERSLKEDGTDWALDIRPIFAPVKPKEEPPSPKYTETDEDVGEAVSETIPASLCVATLRKEDLAGSSVEIGGEKIKKEIYEEEIPFPAALCVTSLAREGEDLECEDFKATVKLEMPVKIEPKPEHVVFPCKSCGITFSSEKYVEQHGKWCRGARTRLARGEAGRLVRSGEKRYQCSTCGYSTDVSSHLSAHLRRHTGERPYACQLCPYRAAEACTLARHRLAHSGARPYACPVCPHRAAFAGDLQKHLRRHTGERPFACLQCPYRAARPGSLKEHVLSQHGGGEGGRRFPCRRCPHVASGPAQLRKHARSHGGGGGAPAPAPAPEPAPASKLFPCYLCPYNATALHNLTKHIQTSHPDLISLYKPTPT